MPEQVDIAAQQDAMAAQVAQQANEQAEAHSYQQMLAEASSQAPPEPEQAIER
ncbi:MAG TPA: hypothetical protein VFE25_11920 [Opitutaceae bacterium]|jgi:hypothetical protein|nr:hypothetical protein [Opitutaceae bacterium]